MSLFSIEDSISSKNTRDFLSEIAKHASNRSEMKDVEYKVLIMPAPPEEIFYVAVVDPEVKCFRDIHSRVDPEVKCFRDIHSRKPADQNMIEDHVVKYHLPHLIHHIDNYGNIFMENVVPGMYQYQRSITGKRRRWERVESMFD